MQITVKARTWKSQQANGWRADILVNGEEVRQPIHNFRKTERGAKALANTCAEGYAEDMRKFGNEVIVIPV